MRHMLQSAIDKKFGWLLEDALEEAKRSGLPDNLSD